MNILLIIKFSYFDEVETGFVKGQSGQTELRNLLKMISGYMGFQ